MKEYLIGCSSQLISCYTKHAASLETFLPVELERDQYGNYEYELDSLRALLNGSNVLIAANIDIGTSFSRTTLLKDLLLVGIRPVSFVASDSMIDSLVGINSALWVDSECQISANTKLGYGSVVSEKSYLGHAAKIGDYVYLGYNNTIGSLSSIGSESVIGRNFILPPGSNVGAACWIHDDFCFREDIPFGTCHFDLQLTARIVD